MKRQTIQRVTTPTALLVGLTDELAAACHQSLSDGGLKVLRVAHVAAATERIPVVMPQLVVTVSSLPPDEIDVLRDRCLAVGAEILQITAEQDRRALGVLLKEAANVALIRALQRT